MKQGLGGVVVSAHRVRARSKHICHMFLVCVSESLLRLTRVDVGKKVCDLHRIRLSLFFSSRGFSVVINTRGEIKKLI